MTSIAGEDLYAAGARADRPSQWVEAEKMCAPGVGRSEVHLLRNFALLSVVPMLLLGLVLGQHLKGAIQHRSLADTRQTATIDLGRNLGLQVIAEGVETEAAWLQLAALGCDKAQGYLFSRPIPAHELSAWLNDHRGTKAMARVVGT